MVKDYVEEDFLPCFITEPCSLIISHPVAMLQSLPSYFHLLIFIIRSPVFIMY